MSQEPSLRDLVRARKTHAEKAAAMQAAIEQQNKEALESATKAWPTAHQHLLEALRAANTELKDEGSEERFHYHMIPPGPNLAMCIIELSTPDGVKATADVSATRTGNVFIQCKHSVRKAQSTFKIANCSTSAWRKVLTQLYSLTLPANLRR